MSCRHQWTGAVIKGPVNHILVDQCEKCGKLRLQKAEPQKATPYGYIDPADMARVQRYREQGVVCSVPVHLRITEEDMPEGSVPFYAAPPAQGIDLGQQQDAERYRFLRSKLATSDLRIILAREGHEEAASDYVDSAVDSAKDSH